MIVPDKLKKGDIIGVVAPSNPIIGDNIEEIKKMIDGIECMTEVRKDFYKKILEYRYEILKTIYRDLK